IHQDTMQEITWTAAGEPSTASAQDAVHAAITIAQNRNELAGPYLLNAPEYMSAAAISTTIAMLFGFLLSLGWIWRTFQAGLPPRTLARVLAALAILGGVGYLLRLPAEWVIAYGQLGFLAIVALKMGLMGLLFLGILFALREFGPQDLAR